MSRKLVEMHWVLVPYWWSKLKEPRLATFNARVETVTEKPFFRVQAEALPRACLRLLRMRGHARL
jgi:putative SOS response-associated peptidase YedK